MRNCHYSTDLKVKTKKIKCAFLFRQQNFGQKRNTNVANKYK
jgi:hypothetical protein